MNLLNTPLVSVEQAQRRVRPLTLPALIAELLSDSTLYTFPRLAPEQHGALWRLLVRSAGHALRTRGLGVADAFSTPPQALEHLIRRVLEESVPVGAWEVFPDQPGNLAFLQAPGPREGGTLKDVSVLTSAIGSKNHDRKTDRIAALDVEQAVYALLDLQFGAIYGGSGLQSTQLIGSQSGAGSGCPFVGARVGDGLNETFFHDVDVLLSGWDRTRESGLAGDVWGLWVHVWDGHKASAIPAANLTPAFIPLARRVSLIRGSDDMVRSVMTWTAQSNRVDDHTQGGALGDPFTPLIPNENAKGPMKGMPKVRGTPAYGYTYREVGRVLAGSDGMRPSPSLEALAKREDLDERADVRVVFEGTAFGQGKTEGFHRREILLPPGAFSALVTPRVRLTHGHMLQSADLALKAIAAAARVVLHGTTKKNTTDEAVVFSVRAALDREIDAAYVPFLLAAAARPAEDEGWRDEWIAMLRALAFEVWARHESSLPTATGSRYQRLVEAGGVLGYRLRPESFIEQVEGASS